MKIILFGKNGKIGSRLHYFLSKSFDLYSFDSREANFLYLDSIISLIEKTKPDIIINAAGCTDVDYAQLNPYESFLVNTLAPIIIANKTNQMNCGLISFSSDYVYDGKKGKPYLESDCANPLSIYGITKLIADEYVQKTTAKHLIFRTSWVYDHFKECFVKWVVQNIQDNKNISIPIDSVGNPTWSDFISKTIFNLIWENKDNIEGFFRNKSGLYNLAGNGHTTKFEFALEILKIYYKLHPNTNRIIITPSKLSWTDRGIIRPINSALNCSYFEKTFNIEIPNWKEQLINSFDHYPNYDS